MIVKVYKYIANQRRVRTPISNICMNKLRNTNNTEPKVAAAIARRVVVTVGNATVGSTAAPAPAPFHAVGPRRRTYRIVGIVADIRTCIPVFAPLPYIT